MLSRDQFSQQLEQFAVKAQEKGWDTPEGAFDNCLTAVAEFKRQAPARHVQVYGYTGDTSKSHPKWQELASKRYDDRPGTGWSHHVPVVDTEDGPKVVDWTARQLDRDAPFPLVDDEEAFRSRWDKSYDI